MTGWYKRLRAWALRVLGVPSREDIARLQTELRRLNRQLVRAGEESEREQRKSKSAIRVMTEGLDRVDVKLGTDTRGIDGRLRHVERNVHSLVRRGYLDQSALPFPHNILSQRFHELSQNEEDGITLAFIRQVGESNRRFVEIGAGVNGGNTGFLAESCGWTGLMVDGSPARADKLHARFAQYGVHTRGAWITTDNVNQLVSDSELTGEIDLLSLDIDGNDYWVWQRLDVCSPRIVILEFNAAFGPERAVTVPYDPAFDRGTFATVTRQYYGASLAAFERLGREKGYRLVLVEPRGVNAYFLRDDVGPDLPALPAATLHPDPTMDAQPLFDLLAKAGLSLVDLDARE
ncbi:MAG: hypothetical protein O3A25_13595 [Acidobacteria bacterium]|nr:hypothetical protein [Acidobacteriota bacterium]